MSKTTTLDRIISCPAGMTGWAVEPWSRGEYYAVAADWAQASSPVMVYGEDGWGSDGHGRQVADFRHLAEAALESIIREAIAMGGDEPEDEDIESIMEGAVQIEHLRDGLIEMEDMLSRHGSRFAGNNVRDEAIGWLDAGLDPADADDWCEIGCWDADTAASLRASGVTPRQAHEAAGRLTAGLDDAAEKYTYGDPIYSTCNGDTPIQEILDATEEL